MQTYWLLGTKVKFRCVFTRFGASTLRSNGWFWLEMALKACCFWLEHMDLGSPLCWKTIHTQGETLINLFYVGQLERDDVVCCVASSCWFLDSLRVESIRCTLDIHGYCFHFFNSPDWVDLHFVWITGLNLCPPIFCISFSFFF